jgi:hypothetical protein
MKASSLSTTMAAERSPLAKAQRGKAQRKIKTLKSDDKFRMPRYLYVGPAWACLIFIIYATLSSSSGRPELTTTEPALVVFIERFGAYGLLGFLFCLAYPRRLAPVCMLVLGSAVVLELLQIVIPLSMH